MIIIQKAAQIVDPIANIVPHGTDKLIVNSVLRIITEEKMAMVACLNQVPINVEVVRLVYGKDIKYAKNVNLISNQVNMDNVNQYVPITANTVAMIPP